MRTLSAVLVTISLVVVGVSTPVLAGDTPETTIDRVNVFDTNELHIKVANPINPAGCPNGDYWFRVDNNAAGYGPLLTIATAALLSGKNVVVRVHDTECYGGWPKLRKIELLR